MIKSKRKTTVYPQRPSRATYKIDSYHSWDYNGTSKNMGNKYVSNNARVNESNYPVTKTYVQGVDIVDA